MVGSKRALILVSQSAFVIMVLLLALPSFGEAGGAGKLDLSGIGSANWTGSSFSLDGDDSDADDGGGFGGGPSAEAQEDEDDGGAGGGMAPKFQFHGFLTQAYATSSFVKGGPTSPTSDESALGIPEDGTTDYRFLALQFRYSITPKDTVIVQLSSRAIGFSPIASIEDEIELDWAFYQRRLSDYLSLKVGRVQIPLGIYNEIRDVGTILPFYRPPFTFYREGSFTSETVDGVVLSYTFAPESTWSLEADVYAGEWDQFEVAGGSLENAIENSANARAKDAYGFQLWLNTPVDGLRFGLGGNSKRLTKGILRLPGVKGDRIDDWYFSLDGTFERFVIRGEYHEFDPTLRGLLPAPLFFKFPTWYVQAGIFATEKFHVWLQYETAGYEAESTIFTVGSYDRTDREDSAIGLNFNFRPDLVLKVEYHEVEEEEERLVPVPAPFPPFFQLNPVIFKADDGSYTIVSLSVSF